MLKTEIVWRTWLVRWANAFVNVPSIEMCYFGWEIYSTNAEYLAYCSH
jgi:hypothetical protein